MSAPTNKTPAPMEAISRMVQELMDVSIRNGANSVSMPDDYVAVAHFICYPGQYEVPQGGGE